MIYILLPTGSYHGWGVCGKYITKEMSRMTEVRLVTECLDFGSIGDEFDYRLLKSRLASEEEHLRIRQGSPWQISLPVLQAINNKTGKPNYPHFRGSVNVGYTFFEDNILPKSNIENGQKFFDTVVTGSRWCEEVLRDYGLTNVETIIQGIDPTIFNPIYAQKEYFQDRFVVFSGGKFELRKGQDIVITAYKILQDKFKDVMLVNSWFNQWPFSMNTMVASPYIKFSPTTDDYATTINRLLHDHGIDLERVITLPPYPNIMMSRIYKNSDIGLFPNRCEGGTNLVLMEYMACGKPVIASYNSGHKDILTASNSIRIENMRSITIASNDVNVAVWDEPSLDEVVEKLLWSYYNRDKLQETAQNAGEDLSRMTWKTTAEMFFKTLQPS